MASDSITSFAGKSVLDWRQGDPLPDFATTIPRFAWNYGDDPDSIETFQAFLTDPAARAVTGLVFGMIIDDTQDYVEPIVAALVEQRTQLPHLTALYLGDIRFEESEISWITLGDVSPIFTAYPHLEHFHILGCASSYSAKMLHFGILDREHLKTLTVETGSMDHSIVHDILRSHLPELEHLELWTGSENYGANFTVEDFAPLFTEPLFPHLRYLGLCNSEFADDLAIALSQSSLLEQLEILDLSSGVLSDVGATALLNCPAIHHLKKLDIHHHYCSQEIMQRLQALDIEVNVGEQQEPDAWNGEEQRYVAVSE